MARVTITIVKWLPKESEENSKLFSSWNVLLNDAQRLADNFELFLNELAYKNIKKMYNYSIEIPFKPEDLDVISLNMKIIINKFKTIFDESHTELNGIWQFKFDRLKETVWKIKLKLAYLSLHLINEIIHTYVYYGENILETVLNLSIMYNECLTMDEKYIKKYSMCSNTCAYLLYPLRKFSMTRILQILAQKRAEICCHELIDCLLNTYKATEKHHDDDTSSDSSMEIYRALTRHLTPPVEIRKMSPIEEKEKIDKSENFESMEDLISNEESNVLVLLTMTMKVAPSFLGSDGIKQTKEGERKINTKTKIKVLDYYEQILWSEVGNYLEHIILWWGPSPLSSRPPHSSQHLREWILQFAPIAEIPSFVISTLQSLADALGVHVTSTSWDQNFRLALVASKKPYDQNTGILFSDMLSNLVSLSNLCEITSDWVIGAPVEELPLVEQIPILHRLDHSVHTTRIWAQTETKRLANSWNVDSFFKITQNEIKICLAQLKELRLGNHTAEIEKGRLQVHTYVCANMRAKLVSEVQDNIKKLEELPKECINCLAVVCRTVSLANLQMVFPEDKYWKQIGHDIPDIPSTYVGLFLDRVLTPVLTATDDDIISNMILRLMCESWLDHIYVNKIKFSHYGAYQLLRDFSSVGDWLINCDSVSTETRKKMLNNEILRRCEGVGRLLLRNPGEQIKMNDKNKKIEYNEQNSPKSDCEQLMPAEMYVPNQEKWLELRASGKNNIFTSCCCNF